MRRTNWQNTGMAFEKELELTIAGYHRQKRATLRKVSPPTITLGGGKRIIYLANPFLDYVGVWTEYGSRALFVEAKSTKEYRLKMGTNGLTDKQLSAMSIWHDAGGICRLVWKAGNEVRVFGASGILKLWDGGAKSLEFEQGVTVKRGMGAVVWDFLHPEFGEG